MSKTRSPITTHILDLAKGQPAANIQVKLEKSEEKFSWKALAHSRTNSNGRIEDFLAVDFILTTGNYRLVFDLESYFGKKSFYPEVTIHFQIIDTQQHYHIPLLLSPFGYSTYRGT